MIDRILAALTKLFRNISWWRELKTFPAITLIIVIDLNYQLKAQIRSKMRADWNYEELTVVPRPFTLAKSGLIKVWTTNTLSVYETNTWSSGRSSCCTCKVRKMTWFSSENIRSSELRCGGWWSCFTFAHTNPQTIFCRWRLAHVRFVEMQKTKSSRSVEDINNCVYSDTLNFSKFPTFPNKQQMELDTFKRQTQELI